MHRLRRPGALYVGISSTRPPAEQVEAFSAEHLYSRPLETFPTSPGAAVRCQRMEQEGSAKRQRGPAALEGTAHGGVVVAVASSMNSQDEVELGDDLVHALIDDMNEELGQLVSDFFNVALPADAIARVLSHLSVVDLARCACVSRQWHSIAEDDEPWRKVVERELALADERGHDEASAVAPPAPVPHDDVKAWYRERARLAIAADANWRERNCVLHTAAWGTKGSRLQRGFGPTSLAREPVDCSPRALCFAFSATDNVGDPTCGSNRGDEQGGERGDVDLWTCVVGMSDGNITRLVPSRSGTADGEQPLVAEWAAEVLPPAPPLPHDRTDLGCMWPQLTCLAISGDWVASGDETGQILVWRAANGAPGPRVPFRHGQPLRQNTESAGSRDDPAVVTSDNTATHSLSGGDETPILTPADASAARHELVEKQATLALLEREGWEVHDLPAAIETLQRKLATFEALAVASEQVDHDRNERGANCSAGENSQNPNELASTADRENTYMSVPALSLQHQPVDETGLTSAATPYASAEQNIAQSTEQRAPAVSDVSADAPAAVQPRKDISQEDTRTADSYATMAEQYLADHDAENAARAVAEGLRRCPGHSECTRISQSLGVLLAPLDDEVEADLHVIEAGMEAHFRAALEQLRGGDSPGRPVLSIVPCTLMTKRRRTASHLGTANAWSLNAADLPGSDSDSDCDSGSGSDVAADSTGAVAPGGGGAFQMLKSVLWASVGQDECEIRLWSIPTMCREDDGDSDNTVALEEVRLLVGHTTPVQMLSTCGDGRLASAGSLGASNGDVRIWNLHSGICEMVVASGCAAHESFTCLAASGPRVVVALATGDVRASAVPSGLALPAPLDLGTAEVSRALCVSLSSSLVAVGNAHGAVTVFDTSMTADGDASLCEDGVQHFSFRAHPEPVQQVAWLDPVGRGVSGRGCLLITMGSKAVRLWQIRRAGAEGRLQQGWLWELGRGGCPSMAIAVRRGRLLWLSQPTNGDRQVLQVYDFCDRALAKADTLASVSLAEDGARGHAAAAAACDVEVWTGQGGGSRGSQLTSFSEYGWLDAKEADRHTTQLPHLSTKQKPQLGGFFGSLNSLLSSAPRI